MAKLNGQWTTEWAVQRDCEDHGTDIILAASQHEASDLTARLHVDGNNAVVVTRQVTEWQPLNEEQK